MNPVDVKWSILFDFNLEYNDKDPKYKADNHVRISNCKNVFQKVAL